MSLPQTIRRFGRSIGVALLTAGYYALGPIGRLLRKWMWTAAVRCRVQRMGRLVYVYGPVYIRGTGTIDLGNRGNLYENVLLETELDGRIVIGNDFTVNRGTVVSAHASVRIGDHALIGEYVSIRDSAHVFADLQRPMNEQGFDIAPVCIGNDVWIGRGAVVLKGVTIGDGAVIGANAVVAKDIPAGEVWAGVPARFLRRRAEANTP